MVESLGNVATNRGDLAAARAKNLDAPLIDRLTLDMNRARQAQITQEILEIVAGADALSG